MVALRGVPLASSALLHAPVLNSKHLVIEIRHGEMCMNEFTCQQLLSRVKENCRVSDIQPNGLITYRDCKQLLSDTDYIANIDTRFECILVRLYPVSAIVLHDSVLVIANGNMNLDDFLRSLCSITREYHNNEHSSRSPPTHGGRGSDDVDASADSALPFEVKILECCYMASLNNLEGDMAAIEEKFRVVEQMVHEKRRYQEINMILHHLKQPVVNMSEILKGFTDMMDEYLNDEDSMKLLEFESHMLFYGPETLRTGFEDRTVNRDLENLMEYFDQEVDQMARRSRTLGTSLNELEKHITVALAIKRNEMMRIELICSVLSTAFGAGACLTGLFGMNVVNSFEESHAAFIVISVIALLIMCIAVLGMKILIYRHRV
ncbi:-Magnesium transporter MRS2-11, chloroplastic [Babesia bigemina]|uniref:Magnesium transporter n=1 Tax=Babesia bigemina TaxID=5866 RepID=A0A061DEX4_BABBI|nr:-Magnesium transporter MRS2-11, chloroplastic [Babesia bigemina]CDR98035.1 -Magnesium transporter MRS2-11, chloroplastic [Babesia bigemina]|eukprot:XP_012770221.1 -Magnesium transporter MRS2-11, chloroplastic [Babesia bigemina]